jgi:hypothetical protein
MGKQLIADLRASNEHLKDENAALITRRDELLSLVSDISRNAIPADEAAELHQQIRALIAEVGTLRAQLREPAPSGTTRCGACGQPTYHG